VSERRFGRTARRSLLEQAPGNLLVPGVFLRLNDMKMTKQVTAMRPGSAIFYVLNIRTFATGPASLVDHAVPQNETI
jgi:hypothetical protein